MSSVPEDDAPRPPERSEPLVGRLERVDARSVWAHEERDFTPWLLAHADHLAEALGIDLELEAVEHRVGAFELDLLGRDAGRDTVLIVENQLAATDHGHLGQLLTYAAGTDAGTIVWIATHFSEEHRQAIDWLNQRTDEATQLFAVELELLRIGSSLPAPHFKVIAAPNDWQKRARRAGQAARRDAGGKGALYAAFWPKLIARLNEQRPGWTRRRPETTQFPGNWLDMPCPVTGASFYVSFTRGGLLRHEIYINGGDADANLAIFRALQIQQTAMETAYGGPIVFEELPGKVGCRIAVYADGGRIESPDEHERYVDWFVESGDRLRAALDAIELP